MLPEEIQFLWRQAATIKPVSGSDLQIMEGDSESTDSERQREREALEAAEREEDRPEVSSKEVWMHSGVSVSLTAAAPFLRHQLKNQLCLCTMAGPQRAGRHRVFGYFR